jgi:TolB protein
MGGRNSKVFLSMILTLLILGMLKSGFFVQPANAQGLPVLAGTETRITTNPADQYDPGISGNIIVYTDERGTTDKDIWYYDLATRMETPVTTAFGDQMLPDVSNGIVVYEDRQMGDVFAYSVLTNVTTNISHGAATDPAIGQGLVAWEDTRNGNREIYAMNLTSGEQRRVTTSTDFNAYPDVSNGIIVWVRANSTQAHIYDYDWASNTTRQITNAPAIDENPDVYGKIVVYEHYNTAYTNCDIYMFNLTSGVERPLPFNGWEVRNPRISGDFVSFENISQGVSHVMLWNIVTNKVYQISHGSSSQFLNDIDGNRIVYTDDRDGQFDVYMFTFVANYSLTILNTAGGTTSPSAGTHVYELGSTVSVLAKPDTSYLFDHWEFDMVNVGSANPYTVSMDSNHTLKAVFTYVPPPVSVSISPLSASVLAGQSVSFTSTVSGGYTPYSYQWYLNSNPVPGATSPSWTFVQATAGIDYVYLKVTDAKSNSAQSQTARIAVTPVPVGGYSTVIRVQTKTAPIITYIASLTAFTMLFTKMRQKTIRKR